MGEISDFNVAAASNNSASPAGAPEAMAPSGVNDTIREIMARIKRWYNDVTGSNTSGGSAGAFTLAASQTISAYAAGQMFIFEANHANTGAATLNVDSVGAKAIVKSYDTALAANDIKAGQMVAVVYEATADNFQIISGLGNSTLVSADIGVTVQGYDADTMVTDQAQTMTAQLTLDETAITEYSLTGTVIDPANGSVQYKTLASNTTFTESLADGQGVTLMIDDGTAYTITWPTITWVNNGGSAPTLATSGYTAIYVFQMNSTLYGLLLGDGS